MHFSDNSTLLVLIVAGLVEVKVKAILVLSGIFYLLRVGKKETGEQLKCIRFKAHLSFSCFLGLCSQVFMGTCSK